VMPGGPSSFTITVAAAAIAFSPDGTLVATANRDYTATLWSGVDGSLVRPLWDLTNGHTQQVTGVAFSPDGTRVATSAGDKTIKLWNVADGAHVRTISTGSDSVATVQFSPDGAWVVGGPGARIWDVAGGAVVRSVSGGSNAVFSPSGPTVFMSVSGIKRFGLPDFSDRGEIPASAEVSGAIRSLALSANGAVLASLGDVGVVRLWCAP